MAVQLEIAANRAAVKYPPGVQVRRVLWALAMPFFRLSPRPCFGWRRFLLRLFGARVGHGVHVYASARIVMPWNVEIGDWSSIGPDVLVYSLGRITLGRRATVSHGAHLCAGTHDHTRVDFPLLTPPVSIGDQAWVCTDAFVGPGVTVGEGAVLAARAVAIQDVPAWTVVGGNPAKRIAERVLGAAPGG